ncbi:hypothetical protein LZ198_06395 [Myxococcus sp. K15C18031901]|uniref:hypothetical protein n=1 Tax=Myxococcus dinghuensis TaxID=2906761 RepID=UPI0020A776EC|nr:hypothetical protein [Myxococcus dinghuensis]MCP3098506.1 hypothetical protein [Myxococcus dinghuensis]
MAFRRFVVQCMVLSLTSLSLVLGAGCGAGAPEAGSEGLESSLPEEASLEVSEQELQNCKAYNYYHDEARNPRGPNRCSNSCDCDGMRTCSSFGWCQGVARPPVSCTSPQYYWNEAWNPQGPNRCNSSCQCDGRRTCSSFGWCQGTAR